MSMAERESCLLEKEVAARRMELSALRQEVDRLHGQSHPYKQSLQARMEKVEQKYVFREREDRSITMEDLCYVSERSDSRGFTLHRWSGNKVRILSAFPRGHTSLSLSFLQSSMEEFTHTIPRFILDKQCHPINHGIYIHRSHEEPFLQVGTNYSLCVYSPRSSNLFICDSCSTQWGLPLHSWHAHQPQLVSLLSPVPYYGSLWV